LKKVGVKSETCWPPGPRQKGTSFKGYKLGKLQQAWREHGSQAPDDADSGRVQLRLITSKGG
jgi:hypothetical protein